MALFLEKENEEFFTKRRANMHTLQYAHKFIKNSSTFLAKSTRNYVFSLLICTGKKNCSAMSKEIGIPKKRLYEVYKKSENNTKQVKQSLINIVKKYCMFISS